MITTTKSYTTTTTTILWPLQRTTYFSWHPQLRAGGFCWCKVLLPARPHADGNKHILIREKMLGFSSMVLPAPSPYHKVNHTQQQLFNSPLYRTRRMLWIVVDGRSSKRLDDDQDGEWVFLLTRVVLDKGS